MIGATLILSGADFGSILESLCMAGVLGGLSQNGNQITRAMVKNYFLIKEVIMKNYFLMKKYFHSLGR
jgi:hypothetical protein